MSNPAPLVLQASATQSAGGSSTPVDIGTFRTAAKLTLAVSAYTGVVPLTVFVESAPTAGSALWTLAGVFPAQFPSDVTTIGSFEQVFAGLQRYVRARWLTGPSFTFSVSGEAHVTYATPADLAALGLPAAALSAPVTPSIQGSILLNNTSLIESYVRGRYKLPFSAVPGELKAACAAISAYDVLVWRGFNPDEYDSNFKIKRDFYVGSDHMKGWLDRLAAGAVSIDAELDATPDQREGAPKIRSRKLRGWYCPNGDDDDRV